MVSPHNIDLIDHDIRLDTSSSSPYSHIIHHSSFMILKKEIEMKSLVREVIPLLQQLDHMVIPTMFIQNYKREF